MNRLLAHPVLGSLFRGTVYFILVLFSYLCQVCVMPYITIGGISPNLLLVTIAVITVGFGRLRGFWTGAIFGILLEVITPTVKLLSMAFYAAGAIVAGFFFADRNQQQLEYRRNQGRSGTNMNPLLRTPLCCLVLSVMYHTVNIIKIYLSGYELQPTHFTRGLGGIVLTVLLCLLLMLPMRRLVGLRYVPLRRQKPLRYEG